MLKRLKHIHKKKSMKRLASPYPAQTFCRCGGWVVLQATPAVVQEIKGNIYCYCRGQTLYKGTLSSVTHQHI